VLFYNAGDGSAVGGRIVPGGFATRKQYPAGGFSANWTHVVSRSSSRLRPPWQAIQGYAWPTSVAPSETVSFYITTGTPSYQTTCVRFRNASGPLPAAAIDANQELIDVPLLPTESRPGHYQFTDFGPAEGGERWQPSFTFDVPVPFVVNPPAGSAAKLALLANINTWTAYNYWGGYSRYGLGVRGELWLLNWLQENGYDVDVWTDLDFHDGIDGLQGYSAIILSTHPEYWSMKMMDSLKAYLDGGGHLVNLGANGVYDAVDISDDFSSITVYGAYGTGRTNLFRQIGKPESAVLGIAFPWKGDHVGNCPSSRVPYTPVDLGHRFMAGIAAGDEIGAQGWSYPTDDPPGPACAAGLGGRRDRRMVAAGFTHPGLGHALQPARTRTRRPPSDL
jgi:hypothetical protein